ncbi:GGDEF domain-containing protein [Streptomyces sp. MBT56]|uniref:GGDEF domain-containing protein n=1 Tax=unclassified Streptomyces TaxID=2593676 RepID=UPI00190C8FAE|nr:MULTISPECIES: GGDEF domain-containing protein [unclassified Streptomyces]MBK3557223.1 GGDEF domain-containing protein [Streptomyces sp. MBT56]MBK3601855.1 GGDEF domain-containing protein [Streptomyces sp. MBT54]MBK3618179.1 GGDEF domain-containing protein [Streptomyces sp. MBT98]MBK3625828.1 GGDEF domain-containing protein [Streptomyces sp. MBT49]
MSSLLRFQARIGQRTLLLTTAALPLTGWTVHALTLHRRLADARKDLLTGLPLRPEFTAYSERLLRTRHRNDLHVLMLDGVDFKGINDTYGHAAGDTVIQTMGRRLARWSANRQALAARLGGDEFAVCAVLPPAAALAEITELREQLQQPLQYEEQTLRLDVSIGIARAADLPGETMGRILRGADKAMYKVKKGKATFPYFATRADAYAKTVNGRRAGRRGTHLLADVA